MLQWLYSPSLLFFTYNSYSKQLILLVVKKPDADSVEQLGLHKLKKWLVIECKEKPNKEKVRQKKLNFSCFFSQCCLIHQKELHNPLIYDLMQLIFWIERMHIFILAAFF